VDGAEGAGTWTRWLDALDANDFKAANALLRAAPVTETVSPAPTP
jgi:hypothetical protein